MKKRILTIFLLVCLILCFTSCMKVDMGITVNKNGTVDVNMIYAISKQYTDMMEGGTGLSEDEVKEYEEKGWEYETYEDDEYSGYKVSIKGQKMDNVITDGESNFDFSTLEDSKYIKKDGDKFIIDFSPFTEEDKEELGDLSSLEAMGASITFTVNLPYAPIKSNAQETSNGGKTLKWNLLKLTEGENIHVEFSMSGTSSVIKYILIAVICLAIVAIAAVLISKGKKKPAPVVVEEAPVDIPEEAPVDIPEEAPVDIPEEAPIDSPENTETLEEEPEVKPEYQPIEEVADEVAKEVVEETKEIVDEIPSENAAETKEETQE